MISIVAKLEQKKEWDTICYSFYQKFLSFTENAQAIASSIINRNTPE